MDDALKPLVDLWVKKIDLAMTVKREQFQDDADEAMRFFDGPYDFMYENVRTSRAFQFLGKEEDGLPRPSFGMTVNKVAEMVQIFGPVLYHRNPVRKANPRKMPMLPPELLGDPMDPMAQQMMMAVGQQMQQGASVDMARAILLEHYLNYTPEALGLKNHSRWAIDEAIIKGMGTLWHEIYQPPGANFKMIGSFFDTVDNLAIDSDMETMEDAKWIARKCVHPVWEVEEEYGLPPGSLKPQLESHHQQAYQNAVDENDYRKRIGRSNDLCVYWKIYSKMGMGGRLSNASLELHDVLETLGKYCFLAVCPTCPYPLNLPPGSLGGQDMMQRVQWPTPFWADDTWPFTPIQFHTRPRKVWPMSHLKPGMGELKFINWAYSFVAGKIKISSRDFIAMKKSLGEEMKNAILHGSDYELLEIEEAHGTIAEVVGFLQHPQFNGDIWKVVEAVEANFERRVGLTELMYGQSNVQLRSAAEADVKAGQLRVRPDDMAAKVEDAMTDVARKEALAIRWHLQSTDVQPMLGDFAAQMWGTLVVPADPLAIIHQIEYRIEANSARKPNKDRDAANMTQAMQTLFNPLWQFAMTTGQVQPVNALIADWAKSIDLDASKYMIQPPPMPMMPAPGGAPAPEQGGGEQPVEAAV